MRAKSFTKTSVAIGVALALTHCTEVGQNTSSERSQESIRAAEIWPHIGSPVGLDENIEQRITDLLESMTIEQKIAQMIQPEIRDITVDDMRKYGFGSYLNGGGSFPNNDKYATPEDWIALADAMYEASMDTSLNGIAIPTMWGTDAVHGHNNVIGATIFPHNIGLGAANNPALIEDIATVTAREVMVTGIDWVFAPTVAVAKNLRWGRTYESYSENPSIVRDYAAAIVSGLQGPVDQDFLSEQRVISTVKHFVGDGGTTDGIDQGDAQMDERTLFEEHAQGYVGGLHAGAQTVMATFNSWNGVKIHGHEYLLTDVLKNQMGFDGFVVGDWNGHGQIPGCTNYDCPQAALAGLDVYMVPTDAWQPLYYNLVEQVKTGVIPESRVDDAVRRILRVKMRAGLFDKPSPSQRPLAGRTELIGADEHRAVAREAVRQSLVLLKNDNQLLPLAPQQRFLLAGPGAHNIGQQSGGWTISWQGTGNSNEDFPGGTSIYQGIAEQVEAAGGSVELAEDGQFTERPDVAIVVFGEEPYAEGNGDIANLDYQRGNAVDLALLQSLKEQGIPVVSLFISGRPLWVNPEINASDAFVAIWLPGTEGQGIADVILRDMHGDAQYDMTGRLPFTWPADPRAEGVLLPLGSGLSYGDEPILGSQLPEDIADELETEDLVIFERAVQSPWLLEISSSSAKRIVESSVQSVRAIRTETFDDRVQEDARRFRFDGSEPAAFNLVTPFPRDLRAFATEESALSVTLRIESDVPQHVDLQLYCGDNCGVQENIASHLSELSLNEWHTLHFNLSCLQDAGLNLAQVGSVLGMATEADWVVSFNDIRVIPTTNTAEYICVGQ